MLPFKIVLPSRMAPYMPHQQLLRPYWENRSHLTIVDELLQYDDRILVPRSMRLQILDCIHTGHLGLTKCRSRARTSVWWPGPSTQIGELIIRCHTCAKWTTNAERTTYTFVLPSPLPPPPTPERGLQQTYMIFKEENTSSWLTITQGGLTSRNSLMRVLIQS